MEDNEYLILDESLVGDMWNKFKSLRQLKQEWQKALKNFVYRRSIKRMITPKQEELLKKYYEILKSDNPIYAEYKRAFNFYCQFMGLTNRDVIIEYITFGDDKYDKDRRVVTVRYSKGRVKIKIPEGLSLVHVSPVKGITALNPTFKSKQAGTYLCPDRRVYFTIEKDIKASRASLENVKIYRYRPKEKIEYAYIDPACQTFDLRAVYVESTKPIPVEPYVTYLDRIKSKLYGLFSRSEKPKEEEEPKQEAVKESANELVVDGGFDGILEYADYEQSEVIQEFSFSELLKQMRNWNTSNEGSPKQYFKNHNLSEDEYVYLKECLLRMQDADTYAEYKQYFSKLCRFCHILPTGTVIYDIHLDEHSISVTYVYNTKKIQIPKDAVLYHMSKTGGIKALNPTFKSKQFSKAMTSRSQYFYSSPRVYLTLNKIMFKWFADYNMNDTVYQYVVDKPINEAYVDPLVNSFWNRAIYVETTTPLKVVTLEEWQKRQEASGKMKFHHKGDTTKVTAKREFTDWALWYGLEPIDETTTDNTVAMNEEYSDMSVNHSNYDGPFSSLQEEMQYLMTMDEVYFGKTPSIAAIEQQLDICRRKYMGTKLMPNQDADFIKLNHMIEDQFGFGNFCLYVTFDPIAAAATMPIEYSFSIDKKDNNYIVDAQSFRFKKEYNYTCMVIMTTGLIFNSEFTTEEIMACLLYELGQNFYSCFSHNNAILSNVYAISNIAKSIASSVQLYLNLSDAANFFVNKNQQDVAQFMTDLELDNDPKLKEAIHNAPPEKAKAFIDALNKENLKKYQANDTIQHGTKKLVNQLFAGNLLAGFVVSPMYLKLQKSLKDKFSSNATIQSCVISLSNYITLVGKYILSNISALYKMGMQAFSGTLLKARTMLDYIVPLSNFIGTAKNPMSWLAQPVNYRVEQAANNFPTMYGYGAPMVSYFEKMRTSKKVEWLSHFIKANPFIGVLYDIVLLPSKIIMSVFDSNPHNITRCHDQIKLLEAELSKQNLPAKMKNSILKDIQACKDQIKQLTDISKGVDDPDISKKLFNKAFEDFFGGVGLRDKFFSDKSKFSQYDANVRAKLSEAGLMPAHEDCWYLSIDESSVLNESAELSEQEQDAREEFCEDFDDKIDNKLEDLAEKVGNKMLSDSSQEDFIIGAKDFIVYWFEPRYKKELEPILNKMVSAINATKMCTGVIDPQGLIKAKPIPSVLSKYTNKSKVNECVLAMMDYLDPSSTTLE